MKSISVALTEAFTVAYNWSLCGLLTMSGAVHCSDSAVQAESGAVHCSAVQAQYDDNDDDEHLKFR